MGLQRHPQTGHSVDDHVRRPSRTQASGGSRRSPRSQRFPSGDMFSDGRYYGEQLGQRSGNGSRRRTGRRGQSDGRQYFARTGHEHKEKPAVRTKFRVFLRRPVSGGQNGSILCKGNPEPGGILLHQALRGQLSGGTPHGDERGRRRANPPGDLPDRI